MLPESGRTEIEPLLEWEVIPWKHPHNNDAPLGVLILVSLLLIFREALAPLIPYGIDRSFVVVTVHDRTVGEDVACNGYY